MASQRQVRDLRRKLNGEAQPQRVEQVTDTQKLANLKRNLNGGKPDLKDLSAQALKEGFTQYDTFTDHIGGDSVIKLTHVGKEYLVEVYSEQRPRGKAVLTNGQATLKGAVTYTRISEARSLYHMLAKSRGKRDLHWMQNYLFQILNSQLRAGKLLSSALIVR